MRAEVVDEPELEFGGRGRHIDPRFGITNYGPANLGSQDAPRAVRVGLVGPADRSTDCDPGWRAAGSRFRPRTSGTRTSSPPSPAVTSTRVCRRRWFLATGTPGQSVTATYGPLARPAADGPCRPP